MTTTLDYRDNEPLSVPEPALSLLSQAERGLAEAALDPEPALRFALAYLAALRGGAAAARHARPPAPGALASDERVDAARVGGAGAAGVGGVLRVVLGHPRVGAGRHHACGHAAVRGRPRAPGRPVPRPRLACDPRRVMTGRALAGYGRLLEVLRIEGERLASSALGADPHLPVRYAEGMTLGETVRHVGSVYRMVVAWLQSGDQPTRWQRAPVPGQSLVEYLRSGHRERHGRAVRARPARTRRRRGGRSTRPTGSGTAGSRTRRPCTATTCRTRRPR